MAHTEELMTVIDYRTEAGELVGRAVMVKEPEPPDEPAGVWVMVFWRKDETAS